MILVLILLVKFNVNKFMSKFFIMNNFFLILIFFKEINLLLNYCLWMNKLQMIIVLYILTMFIVLIYNYQRIYIILIMKYIKKKIK